VDPEPVEPGFLDHDDREMAPRTRLRLVPQLRVNPGAISVGAPVE